MLIYVGLIITNSFEKYLEDIGREYTDLLYNTEILVIKCLNYSFNFCDACILHHI